jgi:hypothetical protein
VWSYDPGKWDESRIELGQLINQSVKTKANNSVIHDKK